MPDDKVMILMRIMQPNEYCVDCRFMDRNLTAEERATGREWACRRFDCDQWLRGDGPPPWPVLGVSSAIRRQLEDVR
jgi:hypothetical protein